MLQSMESQRVRHDLNDLARTMIHVFVYVYIYIYFFDMAVQLNLFIHQQIAKHCFF